MFSAASPTTMKADRRIRVNITAIPGVTHLIRIPEGYEFDGATIPRWAWSIIGYPFEPDLILPACVHDWYCENAATYHERVIGDTVFLKLLADSGVPRWRRLWMFAAVRVHTFMAHRKPT